MLAVASTILSIIAVGFSIFVFIDGRTRYKRDMFLKIHEIMISEPSYRGRQLLLSQKHDQKSINDIDLSDRAQVSRAIALFDTIGLYLHRDYLIEEDVISMWGPSACRVWRAAQPFIERRAQQSGDPNAYPYFRYLVGRSEASRLGRPRPDAPRA
jgi:hypothetical protein